MKSYIVILFSILITLFNYNIQAQKSTMNKIKVSYLQLPLHPLNENIKTYKTVLNLDLSLENTDIEKLNNQYLKLYGYEKVIEGEDLLIRADFGDFNVDKELITDDVYNVNKGENVTGYYYELTFSYPVQLILETSNGEIIYETEINQDEKLMHDDFGKWTYSISELDSKFNTEKDNLVKEVKNKCDKQALNEIRDILRSNFSYYHLTRKIKIALAKGKKYDYSDLESAISHIEKAFEMISSESQQGKINKELNEAIKIWETALLESSDNKNARINEEISTMLYYNIGIANWWMLDFTKARDNLNKALNKNLAKSKPSSSNEKDINEILESMNDYEQRLKIHHKI